MNFYFYHFYHFSTIFWSQFYSQVLAKGSYITNVPDLKKLKIATSVYIYIYIYFNLLSVKVLFYISKGSKKNHKIQQTNYIVHITHSLQANGILHSSLSTMALDSVITSS